MEVEEKMGVARRRIEAGSASGQASRAVAVATRAETEEGAGRVAAGVVIEGAAKEAATVVAMEGAAKEAATGVANRVGTQEEAVMREAVATEPEVTAPLRRGRAAQRPPRRQSPNQVAVSQRSPRNKS